MSAQNMPAGHGSDELPIADYVAPCGSLFSGAGGFELGFERAGFRTLWQAEVDPWCQRVLARHWPDATQLGDVRSVCGADLPPVAVVTFGSPCQDMSVAGARQGLSGARSGLFHEAVRIINEMRKATDGRLPAWAVWENVPGALTSADGADFATVLDELARIGAVEIEWRVLDARFFGVPQRRRRVFLVAGFHSRGDGAPPVLLEPPGRQRCPAPGPEPGQEVAGILGAGSAGGGWASDTDRMTFIPVSSRCDTARGHRYDGESDTLLPVSFAWQAAGKNDASGALEVNQTPTLPRSQTLAVAYRKAQKARDPDDCERWEEDALANTLDASGHGPRTATAIVTDLAVRRLTPRECERLMGWPDDHTRWTADGREVADSQRYRMCGNGVVASVAEWIARRLQHIDGSMCEPDPHRSPGDAP